jgi:tRNA(Ile)-lysidine synthase
MAASRKPKSASVLGAARAALAAASPLSGKRVCVGLSGGVDSVVLLHVLRTLAPEFGYRLSALHVNHGLSRSALDWQRRCAALCRRWHVPFRARRVRVAKSGEGIEAAARRARRKAFATARVDAIALGHQLDDQAETVLLNLLRGAGVKGAAAMPAAGRLGAKRVLRPLLGVRREDIVAYARAQRLSWIEDEMNADEALARGFLRVRLGPLLESKFPRWREALARAARLFAAEDERRAGLLREFLAAQGLRAPSERRLAEMLRQLSNPRPGARALLIHDGAALRLYRGRVSVAREAPPAELKPVRWRGEEILALTALGGELRFARARGGIDPGKLDGARVTVRTRAGGERLRPDAKRPRRTLKNLFQEAGIPPWERERLPLLFCGEDLVWVPGLGVDAAYRAPAGKRGIVPIWRAIEAKAGNRR